MVKHICPRSLSSGSSVKCRPSFRPGTARMHYARPHTHRQPRAYVLEIALVRTLHGSPRECQLSTYLQNTPDTNRRLSPSLFDYSRIIWQKNRTDRRWSTLELPLRSRHANTRSSFPLSALSQRKPVDFERIKSTIKFSNSVLCLLLIVKISNEMKNEIFCLKK